MNYMLLLALILALALIGGRVGAFFGLPRITGYILTGLITGPAFAGLFTKEEGSQLSFAGGLRERNPP